MGESFQANNRGIDLPVEIEKLRQEIAALKQENIDLEVALQTAIDHGDTIEDQIQNANQQLRAEIRQRQQIETRLNALLAIVYQQKNDLEILLETLREHGDVLDIQWYEKLQEAHLLASFDSLTQIANRRRFDEHLEAQWKQMARERAPLSVILCDVDHFKQYNDTYGHLAGDECLKKVAGVLSQTAKRPSDLVARYGGEEFAAILPQTDRYGATIVATRIQTKLEQLSIPHENSPISQWVTLSMGVVCTVPTHDQSPRMLLDQADQLLYFAKHQGRNRIAQFPNNPVKAGNTASDLTSEPRMEE